MVLQERWITRADGEREYHRDIPPRRFKLIETRWPSPNFPGKVFNLKGEPLEAAELPAGRYLIDVG